MISDKARFMSKVSPDPNSGCWHWTASRDSQGYGKFRLHGKTEAAHRAAYELLVGPIPAKAHICHRCDVPACVNPSHLFIGTNAANQRDKAAKGRTAHRKLTDADARYIRAAKGKSQRTLADQFNVSRATIRNVIEGSTFKHLND